MTEFRRCPRSPVSGGIATPVATTYKRGDILLRAGEEEWIMELTDGPYSHAGICVDPGDAKEAADAHPVDDFRSAGKEVARVPISAFFSVEHAAGGGDVFRYTGPAADALKAAAWAAGECGKAYTFDLMDPILDGTGKVVENNDLYCSEFVWRSYKYGANVALVEEKDFINLISPERIDKTVKVMLPIARENGEVPNWLPDIVARGKLKKELKKRHNGYFVAPSQLAGSALVRKAHAIRGGAKSGAPAAASK